MPNQRMKIGTKAIFGVGRPIDTSGIERPVRPARARHHKPDHNTDDDRKRKTGESTIKGKRQWTADIARHQHGTELPNHIRHAREE